MTKILVKEKWIYEGSKNTEKSWKSILYRGLILLNRKLIFIKTKIFQKIELGFVKSSRMFSRNYKKFLKLSDFLNNNKPISLIETLHGAKLKCHDIFWSLFSISKYLYMYMNMFVLYCLQFVARPNFRSSIDW